MRAEDRNVPQELLRAPENVFCRVSNSFVTNVTHSKVGKIFVQTFGAKVGASLARPEP